MRIKILMSLCASLLAVSPTFAQDPSVEEGEFHSSSEDLNIEQLSEMLGYLLGQNLQGPGFCFDVDAIVRGIRKGVDGEEAPMAMDIYQEQLQILQELAMNTTADDNLQKAEAYLAQNATHPDTIELEAGRLQYRVLQKGDGATVEANAAPLIHYTGRYQDGTVFDTSTTREPIALPLSQTVLGFSRGVAGMKEGEKRVLFIHPELGYGTSGPLHPNALLVFEIEVLKADTTGGDDS